MESATKPAAARRGNPGDALVTMTGVGVRRGGRWLLRDVDLTLRRGEIVTVVGPNGGGKTTLARVAIGALKPDVGQARRAAGLTIGYAPQRLHLDPSLPMTVARLMTLSRRARRDDVRAALAETGVERLIDSPASHMSGGELRRALIARALLGDPDLLVLDEPSTGVDFAGETEAYALIERIVRRRGCGLLMISHDLLIVMAATDRVLCLNGHVCCAGAPEEVDGHPEYRRLFGRRAAETHAIYRHHHDHAHALDGAPLTAPPTSPPTAANPDAASSDAANPDAGGGGERQPAAASPPADGVGRS